MLQGSVEAATRAAVPSAEGSPTNSRDSSTLRTLKVELLRVGSSKFRLLRLHVFSELAFSGGAKVSRKSVLLTLKLVWKMIWMFPGHFPAKLPRGCLSSEEGTKPTKSSFCATVDSLGSQGEMGQK